MPERENYSTTVGRNGGYDNFQVFIIGGTKFPIHCQDILVFDFD